MRAHDGTPMVCTGSTVHLEGPVRFVVDQTPVEVREALLATDGLTELTRDGVSVYVAADAPIQAITAIFERVGSV